MKVREVVQLLAKHGWKEMRSRGSHRHFKQPDQRFVITSQAMTERALGSTGNPACSAWKETLNAILKKPGLK